MNSGSRAERGRDEQNAELSMFVMVIGLPDLQFRFHKKPNAYKIITYAIP